MTGRACSKSTFSVCSSRKKNVNAIFHLSPLPHHVLVVGGRGAGVGPGKTKKAQSRSSLPTKRAASTVPSTDRPKVCPLRHPDHTRGRRAVLLRATRPKKLLYATVAHKLDASQKIFEFCRTRSTGCPRVPSRSRKKNCHEDVRQEDGKKCISSLCRASSFQNSPCLSFFVCLVCFVVTFFACRQNTRSDFGSNRNRFAGLRAYRPQWFGFRRFASRAKFVPPSGQPWLGVSAGRSA